MSFVPPPGSPHAPGPASLQVPQGGAPPPPPLANPSTPPALPPTVKIRENLQSGPEKVLTSAINFIRKHRVAIVATGAMVGGVVALGLASAATGGAPMLLGLGVVLLGMGFGATFLSPYLEPALDNMLDMAFVIVGLPSPPPPQAAEQEYKRASKELAKNDFATSKNLIAQYVSHDEAEKFEKRRDEITLIQGFTPADLQKQTPGFDPNARLDHLREEQKKTLENTRHAITDKHQYSAHVSGFRDASSNLGMKAVLAVVDIFRPLGDYYWQRLDNPKNVH